MISKIIAKALSIPHILTLKFSPCINRWYFKGKGVKYGRNLTVVGKVTIDNRGEITIGDSFMMTSSCDLNPISSNLIGHIYCSKTGHISIGNRVGMSSTRIWIEDSLTIGNYVTIGANVLLMDTDCHQIDYRYRCGLLKQQETSSSSPKEQCVQRKSITLEDYCWIGAESIILKGVTIGARSVIGAGSIVTKDIPADCIAAGNPCKVIKFLN